MNPRVGSAEWHLTEAEGHAVAADDLARAGRFAEATLRAAAATAQASIATAKFAERMAAARDGITDALRELGDPPGCDECGGSALDHEPDCPEGSETTP